MRSVCVFCGSARGARPHYAQMAREAGAAIAARGMRLVYGGAASGLMGECARAARDGGAPVLGVIPEYLIAIEGVAEDVEIRRVATLGSRKAMMMAEADAFLVLPGGPGTLEAVFDLIAQRRLGVEYKPVAFIDGAYWSRLDDLLKHMTAEEFTRRELTGGFHFDDTPAGALDWLEHELGAAQAANVG